MDNLTHTLFALTLARTRIGRGGRGVAAALVLASNAPDIDIVATLGGSANYLAWHRGPTHGPLGVVGLALVTAALVWGWEQRVRQRSTLEDPPERVAPFATLLIVSIIGVLCHILMDLPTSYGTRLLSPFSWRWFAIDLLPIIDVYLLAALAAGLVFGRGSGKAGRKWAAIVLVLMAVNYGARAIAHHQALNRADGLLGAEAPGRCQTPRPRPMIEAWPAPVRLAGARAGSCTVETAALPTFFSPFQWRVIGQLPEAYRVYDIDILHGSPDPAGRDRSEAVVTNVWTPAVVEAARTRTGQIFLGFSRFPDAVASVDRARVATVRFTDMRFAVIDADRDVRRPAPFALTVMIGPDHQILRERLGP
jgi:membrane-bound metal-dependent hydrolase YbcI (DUF457 family)